MSLPAIVGPRLKSPYVEDANGKRVSQEWDVLAPSEVDAVMMLAAQRGIVRGCAYRNVQGRVPDAGLVAQQISCEGKPHAPVGGIGRYLISVDFSSTPPAMMSASPGSPPVYRINGTMVSGPIDRWANGRPITNSSDQPADPPVTGFTVEEKIDVEWYLRGDTSVNGQFAIHDRYGIFRNRLNERPWHGRRRGCCLSFGVNLTPAAPGWYKATMEVQYKPPYRIPDTRSTYGVNAEFAGWEVAFLDRGTQSKSVDANGNVTHNAITLPNRNEQGQITDGRHVTDTPVLLNGLGEPIAETARGARALPYIINGFDHLFIDLAGTGV